ncbi:high mobility group B protein 7 [Olea europaea var. sylvestris]|uniref:High mobility group B 7-like n=2 Tax=Magnoliopsida TaxID=3398 RepID=A0A8S0UNN1_OLEEU|nr:high mobility group B protein 7 [Olea europaea var. sylvestris]CAA3021766.1 high mobility group B 7-like [Olea europaea subsp. europaea]
MAGSGASKSSIPPRGRKRVEADSSPTSASTTLKRARDGSAFAKCEECNKDVPVALISFHNCSLDAKIKMNLGAQVVEMSSEVKKNTAEKKKAKSTEPKAKKEKKAKDPNAPKRPPTAFFLFLDDFRKEYKEANPDCKSVKEVAKEGGEKWKSMTTEEKKLYQDRAAELKAEYVKALKPNEEENEHDEEDSTEKEAKEDVEVDDDE